jgi:hypothetical protein
MSTLEKLPHGTLAVLERAVECAAEWRGAYTHDPEALAAFDAELTAMRAALRAVRKQARAVDLSKKLKVYLQDNLRIEITRGDFTDPNSREVKLLLEDEAISSCCFDVVQKPEYED